MSGNTLKTVRHTTKKTPKNPDRRVLHTRDVLGDALVKLMHERPFEEITVQHILDRAGVSRSTFYAHFSDKNDLFLSDAEEFFEMMAAALSQQGDKSRRRHAHGLLGGVDRFIDAAIAIELGGFGCQQHGATTRSDALLDEFELPMRIWF